MLVEGSQFILTLANRYVGLRNIRMNAAAIENVHLHRSDKFESGVQLSRINTVRPIVSFQRQLGIALRQGSFTREFSGLDLRLQAQIIAARLMGAVEHLLG